MFAIGFVTAAGSGTASFSEKRGLSSGLINAGASFGQFIFAPLAQTLISVLGWMGAMWSLAGLTLTALPLTGWLYARTAPRPGAVAPSRVEDSARLKIVLRDAFRDRSYLLLHAGFFTCGFHIAFLVTHPPGQVQLCGLSPNVASWSLAIIGLANIVGSLAAGWSLQFYRGKYVLFWMYASRSLLIALYLFAPKTQLTFYLFAAGLGLTWLATVPPTAGVIGKLLARVTWRPCLA